MAKPSSPKLGWAGFSPLRKGRIHIYCPKCGRKQSNMRRDDELDPRRATLVHVFCERCSDGCKDVPMNWFTSDGKEVWPKGWGTR